MSVRGRGSSKGIKIIYSQLHPSNGMAIYYTNDTMREDHKDRFVSILYFLTRGIKSTKIDSDKVFDNLKAGGFRDRHRARAELVQFLEDVPLPRIKYDGSNNAVNLTDQGLKWAEHVKDRSLYIEYRTLMYG
jgi:hypothetical protein